MAATLAELAARTLKKIKVLGVGEPVSAEDQASAIEKLKAAHYSLDADDLLRWTLADIPKAAEEPYVAMAAFLLAPDFEVEPDGRLWTWGKAEIAKQVNLKSRGTVRAENF